MQQRGDFLSTLSQTRVFGSMDESKQKIIAASLQSKFYTKGESNILNENY